MRPIQELVKSIKIGQIVNPRLIQAPPEITVRTAIEIMQNNKSGYIVIADHQRKVVGIFTETDVLQKVFGKKDAWDKPVSQYMTQNPKVLSVRDTVGQAIELMGKNHFYHIPLVDEKAGLVNVISVRTLIRFLAEFYPTEIYNLPPKYDQIMETAEGG
jgi:CBS domain-containing protein